ncbi:purple acid phosphatase [Mortierella alpina]|nr:purple acid phosphatase [Mortierella alpina]
MRPFLGTGSLLALALATTLLHVMAKGPTGITDIRITACAKDNSYIPGFRKMPQDLNKFSRGSFVHLHFTDSNKVPPHRRRGGCGDDTFESDRDLGIVGSTAQRPQLRLPITQIEVLQGPDADMGPDWEKIDGNLNDGNRGPVLTMFVKRDPTESPIDSIVVKYGFGSHAAIGYDRLPVDLNAGTGGQWVYLYLKRQGEREPITHIAACALPLCTMDDSWTRVNRPIVTGIFKRNINLFYKSVPGERPITSLGFSLDKQGQAGKGLDIDEEMIDIGIVHKNSNVYLTYTRGQVGDNEHAVDNIAVELGSNQIPYNWNAATFDAESRQDAPDWNAQVVYRNGARSLPKAPKLRFKRDGSFKIVQFADIHMATGPHSCHQAPDSMSCTGDVNTLEMMERMLDAERPDLVVFSGDNVDGITSNDAYATMLKYSKPVVDRRIPWTIIFGNHDEEGDLSREEMMRSVQDIPYSLSQRGPLDISGTGNYVLSIQRSDGSEIFGDDEDEAEAEFGHKNSRFHLYFLDSGAYSFNLEYPGWDWIKDDQVEWFRQTSRAITSKYRKKDIPNALAFFHIPIPEYDLTEDDSGRDQDDSGDASKEKQGRIVGDKREGVSTPSYNSGMFDAIYESEDVRATTAGHDHLNDYCLNHRGINLCYGGGLGYGSYGNSAVFRRSRVFEILNHGDKVDTWKRLDNEEMTLVGQQTLFKGKKTRSSSSRSYRPNAPTKTAPQRLTDDIFENLKGGTQYIMGGLRDSS